MNTQKIYSPSLKTQLLDNQNIFRIPHKILIYIGTQRIKGKVTYSQNMALFGNT